MIVRILGGDPTGPPDPRSPFSSRPGVDVYREGRAMVRELTVLDQPQVRACCAPLTTQVLATADDGAVCACDLVAPVGKSQPTMRRVVA